MNIAQYKNEIILFTSIFILGFSYLFKYHTIDQMESNKAQNLKQSMDIKEAISLKKIWEPKNIIQKINQLKEIVPSTKLQWHKNGKKISVIYKEIEIKDFNKVLNKILSLPIQIQEMKIYVNRQKYTMELKCKF